MGAVLVQEINGPEQVFSTFCWKFNDAQLKYSVEEQELLATHKTCIFFHDNIYGCEILIHCDHKNITDAKTKHTNLCILCQCLMLNQDYSAKFKHYAGELNTGVDGLSHLEMIDKVPWSALVEVYAIDDLNQDINVDFPLVMNLIKT